MYVLQVSVNGVLSFRTGQSYCCPETFDWTSTNTHIVAPYWIDNDITTAGTGNVGGSQSVFLALYVGAKTRGGIMSKL